MDVTSKIFIWANSDLDGAASVIALGHIFPEFEYQSCFFGKFQEQYIKWAKNNLENYDKIFVVGMVIDQDLMRKLDDPRIVIISDRADVLKVHDSTLIVEESTSCCRLIYLKFNHLRALPKPVKELILYVDDYNRYALTYDESKYLNALYRKMGVRKFKDFVERFSDGYDGLTETEVALAETFLKEIQDELPKLDLYTGLWDGWSVLSTFSKCSVNEIAKELMDAHDYDIIIIVNTDTKFISFRKPATSTANIANMAESLCGGGGGEFAAGGNITQKFLEFTEELTLL